MTKTQVKNQVTKIFSMTMEQVEAYRVKISLSSADTKAKQFLYKACDTRIAECNHEAAMVEIGDISDLTGGY